MPPAEGNTPIALGLPSSVAVDRFSGSADIRIRFPLPDGRNGLSPALGLSFGSAGSRGVFGMGWGLTGLPAIGVDGDGGVPAYDGTDGYSATLGGRLVPVRDGAGNVHERVAGGFRILRFRAAIDDARIRFEKWVEEATGRVHWRSRDTTNTLTIYGLRADATTRIADPRNPARVYQWLPELQIAATGDAIHYLYAAEDRSGGAGALSAEAGRDGAEPQRHLKRISWANLTPADPADPLGFDPEASAWAFHAVFDYGDHDPAAPALAPDRAWPARPDPYSVASAGFELRTWRLCQRLLVFHHFAELGAAPALAQSIGFAYDAQPQGSRLASVTRTGHRDATSKSAPPLRIEYATSQGADSFAPVPETLAEAAPGGLSTSRSHLVDLYGEGLPGILYDDPAGWSYRRNMGGGAFAPAKLVNARPAHSLTSAALGDFDGDGNMDAMVLSGSGAGHYRFDRKRGEWGPFRPFPSAPKIGSAGRLQRLDLTGDGRADLVVSDGEALVWHKARGSDGYAPEATRVRHEAAQAGAPAGAPPLGTDPDTDYLFADMTGDGLPDQVLIRPGLVAYWPNLGHGRFGRPVLMQDAPLLGGPARFAINRVMLADLDGSGTADLIWLGEGEIQIWTNASGNMFLGPRILSGLPMIDTSGVLEVLDVLGNGGRHLVWSTNASGGAALQMLTLSGPVPNGCVTALDTQMGGRDEITYGHSLLHYRRDQGTDRAWSMPLPTHPVVVDRLMSRDLVQGTETVTEFRYRNGSFDSRRRHFTGFGEVDAIDAPFVQGVDDPEPASAPSLTRSFFDNGSDGLTHARVWAGDPDAPDLPVFALDLGGLAGIDGETYASARAALTGRELRTEIYEMGPDGPAPVPLSVNSVGYSVTLLQPPRLNGRPGLPPPLDRAVMAVTEAENVSALYEGTADDPRITHALILEQDAVGGVRLAADLVYPRRSAIPAEDPQQQVLHAALKRMTRAHTDSDDVLALNQPIEDEEFVIDGLSAPARGWFTRAELAASAAIALAAPLTHDQSPVTGRARRQSWMRHIYWNAGGTDALPLGQTALPARLHHGENAVGSQGFMQGIYGAGIDARLPGLGYTLADGHWWQQGDPILYEGTAGFHRPAGTRLRDGRRSQITRDASKLFTTEARDANGAQSTTQIDYYALAPRRSEDPNGAWSEQRYDPLGVAVLSAHGGTIDDGAGGSLAYGFDAPAAGATGPTLATILADPLAALGAAAKVVAYDLDAWSRDGTPVTLAQLSAADLPHDGSGAPQASGKLALRLSYFNARGGEVSAKQLVEPGPAITRDGTGAVVLDGTGAPVMADAAQRWAASGAVVENAKGEPLRSYRAYYTPDPGYEDDAVLRALGTPASTYYDAAGRSVLRLQPDGSTEEAEYGAWWQRHSDANDTSDSSAWRLSRQILPATDPERRALDGALAHADTPLDLALNGLGQVVRATDSDGLGATRVIRTLYGPAGLPQATIDARGLTATQRTYDMTGRVVRDASLDAGTRQMLYDGADNVVETLQPSGARQTASFDAFDRVTRIDVEHGGSARQIAAFSFADDPTDAASLRANLYGQPVETRDEAGLHRLTAAAPGGVTLATETRLIADAEATVDWAGATPLDAETFRATMRVDALGRVLDETRPDGAILSASYGLDGAMQALSVATEDGQVAPTPILSDARHGLSGQRETARLGNGVTLTRSYDPLTFRVRRITATRSAAGGRAPLLQDLAYTYDPVGNITNLADHAHDTAGGAASAFFTGTGAVSAERRYSYDAFYRLTGCEGRAHAALTGGHQRPDMVPLSDGSGLERFAQSYSYDLAGNLERLRHTGTLSRFTTDFWIDAASNRARPLNGPGGTPAPTPTADFGAGGERVRMDHLAALEWRHDQRLARAVVIDRSALGQPDDDELYVYDGGGTRIRKITRRMLAGGIIEAREVIEIGGARFERLTRDGVRILERRTTRISDEFGEVAELHRWTLDSTARETDDINAVRLRYTLTDHLGSATLRLDEAARVISYEEYLPFGACAFMAGDDARETALKTHSFIARERDAATGLHYIAQRYYASWLCRWISPDPAGDVDGSNRFLYARNNPVTNLDATGLQTTTAGSRGRRVRVQGATPARVEAAFAALPPAEQARLRGLMADNNFNWFMERDGTVHFGTQAEMSALAESKLRSGENVAIVSGSRGQTTDNPDEAGDGGGTEEGEPTETEDGTEEDGTGETTVTGGQQGQDGDGDGEDEEDQDGTDGDGGDGDETSETPEDTAGVEGGEEGGQGRTRGSDKDGTGGGGNSDDPNARGRGDSGTGLGGGTGDPNQSGLGNPGGTGTGTTPDGGPGGSPGGSADGQVGGTGTGPGPGGNGTSPGGAGTTPGDGSPGGAEGGSDQGIPNGSLNGGAEGGAAPEGTNPQSGTGGTRIAPPGSPPPQRTGGSPNGSAEGTAGGNPAGEQGGEQTNGSGGQDQPTTLDHIVRVAGYWHLEFGDSEGGQSGGIPGGMGSLNLGAWGQAAFLALTVVDIALTVASMGGLAGIKASLKVGIKAITTFGRRAVTRVGALFTREFWQAAGRNAVRAGINWNPFRSRQLREFWDAGGITQYMTSGKSSFTNWLGQLKSKVTNVNFMGFRNSNGGRIWASTDVVSGNHVNDLVSHLDSLPGNTPINILTGRHGDTAGFDLLMRENKFFVEDLLNLPSSARIDIHDVTKMTDAQLGQMLESGGDVVLAWCHSEHSRRVIRALGLNFGSGPF